VELPLDEIKSITQSVLKEENKIGVEELKYIIIKPNEESVSKQLMKKCKTLEERVQRLIDYINQ